jgi:hypothetical protein
MSADLEEELLDEFVRRISRPGDMSRVRQAALLTNPLVRSLGYALGVDVAGLDAMHRDARESAIATLRAAAFARFGWTISARAPDRHAYIEAVRIWQETEDSAAVDECLTRWWNDGRAFLRATFGPMLPLAGHHEPTLELLLVRNRLLQKALDHHEQGGYEASVLIVLSQIDGLVLDFTDPSHGFFYKPRDAEFEDDATIAGLPVVLRPVWRAVMRGARQTSISDAFERSPIIHGRHLGFGTQTNSTKAFALLGGVIEWLKPKAHELTERWQADLEARYAGSDELDAEGRRLDRRGFVEIRDSLRWLAIRESNELSQHGTYRDDLAKMFPAHGERMLRGAMSRRDAIRVTVAPDGRSWWAWAKTDSDFCFGIGGLVDRPGNAYYADVGPPGPLGADERWTDAVERPADWAGE